MNDNTITHELGCFSYLAILILAMNVATCGGSVGSGLFAIAAAMHERCECAP